MVYLYEIYYKDYFVVNCSVTNKFLMLEIFPLLLLVKFYTSKLPKREAGFDYATIFTQNMAKYISDRLMALTQKYCAQSLGFSILVSVCYHQQTLGKK